MFALPGPVSDTEEPTAACLGPRDSQQGESPVNANMLARCQIEITVSYAVLFFTGGGVS